MPISKLRPTFTFTEDRLKELKAVVPEAFADGKINWDALKEALGEYSEEEGKDAEHFGLFWPGKREARRLAAAPSKGALLPLPDEGIDENTTRNIFIEGDNLEVLKLLQKSYAGQVRMIYIDPPYNTGSDLIYVDDFAEPLDAYLKRSRQSDEQGNLLTSNPKSDGRFHSNWLNMLFPRLRLARNLLASEGVLFISIDDNEVHHLRTIANEVFGSENFIAQITIQSNPRGRQSERFVATVHEYLLVYARDISSCILQGSALTEEQLKEFKYKDSLGRKYRLLGLRQRGSASRREDRPNMFYPIYVDPNSGRIALEKSKQFSSEVLPRKSTGEDGRWMWARKKVQDNLDRVEAHLISTRNEWDIFVRDYLQSDDGEERTRKLKTIWDDKELNYQNGTQELKQLFGDSVMDYPKPSALLQKIAGMTGDSEGLYMDFFAGSCTTAHAVMDLNRQDGGNRRFIMVQLDEATDNPKWPTIAEVGKERIRRVIAKMRKEAKNKLNLSGRDGPEDLGFKVFNLGRSNFRAWQDYHGEDITQLELVFDNAETPLLDDWSEGDLIVEILLLQGFPLDSAVTEQSQFKQNTVRLVESDFCVHKLYVCFDKKIKSDTVGKLQLRTEDVFVCLDSALTDEAKLQLADVCNLRTI